MGRIKVRGLGSQGIAPIPQLPFRNRKIKTKNNLFSLLGEKKYKIERTKHYLILFDGCKKGNNGIKAPSLGYQQEIGRE